MIIKVYFIEVMKRSHFFPIWVAGAKFFFVLEYKTVYPVLKYFFILYLYYLLYFFFYFIKNMIFVKLSLLFVIKVKSIMFMDIRYLYF